MSSTTTTKDIVAKWGSVSSLKKTRNGERKDGLGMYQEKFTLDIKKDFFSGQPVSMLCKPLVKYL